MHVHKSHLRGFVSDYAILIVLYRSSAIFPKQLNEDSTSIKKCLRVLAPFVLQTTHTFIKFLSAKTLIHLNVIHPPSLVIPYTPSTLAMQALLPLPSFKPLRCRTSLQKNTLLPSLACLQHKTDKENRSCIFPKFLRNTILIVAKKILNTYLQNDANGSFSSIRGIRTSR